MPLVQRRPQPLDRGADVGHDPATSVEPTMTAPTAPLAAVDDVAATASDNDLLALFADGTRLGASPVRCPVTDADAAARHRLDLALRMLRGQPRNHWCRPVGDGAAVVLCWPLPARGIALCPAHGPGPTVLVLAVGRAGGVPDVWRFRWDDDGSDPSAGDLGRRARALLSDL